MTNKDIEIELKFPLLNADEVIKFLNVNGKAEKKGVYQKDTYYTPKHRDFISYEYPYEWLRLRESAKGASLDYKHFHPEGVKKTDYCDEFQTEISDISSFKKILKSLDFKEIVVVEKNRDTWMYKDAEIAIDNVNNLGRFIELELKKQVEEAKEGKDYLHKLLRELNAKVGEEDLRGYPFRILEKEGYMFGK